MANISPIQPKSPPPPQRMTLDSVKRGRIEQPMRVLLYGVEGIGKSTFGANAPAPIFLGAEDGTATLDVARFPEAHAWGDVLDAIRVLTHESHKYETLVIDTLDWLEPMCWRTVCDRAKKSDIEAFGYGKGYTAALDEWRVFAAALDSLWRTKRMHVILLAHARVYSFKNPEGDDFDRYTLKLHEKSGGFLKEWARTVLFANYQTEVLKEGARAKGFGGGSRVIYTERRAAWDAKNRDGLPERLPLDWNEFAAAVAANNGADAVATLRAAIEGVLPNLPADKRAATTAWLATDKAQIAANLRVVLNKTNELIANAKEANQ